MNEAVWSGNGVAYISIVYSSSSRISRLVRRIHGAIVAATIALTGRVDDRTVYTPYYLCLDHRQNYYGSSSVGDGITKQLNIFCRGSYTIVHRAHTVFKLLPPATARLISSYSVPMRPTPQMVDGSQSVSTS